MSADATPFGDPLRPRTFGAMLRPGAILRAAAARLRQGAGPGPLPLAELTAPTHPVPGAAQVQAQIFAQLATMADGSFDEGNGYVYDDWALNAAQQWHVLVDLGHVEAEQRAQAILDQACDEVDRRARRAAMLREELDRLGALLAEPPAARDRDRFGAGGHPRPGRRSNPRPGRRPGRNPPAAPAPAASWGWDPLPDAAPPAGPPPTRDREEP
ncbi:MAG: hypothetical protein JNL54_04155 [Kineosporiaceae bacterium]|nr:hypothetical protein [Kineosporiaceae bacterium]